MEKKNVDFNVLSMFSVEDFWSTSLISVLEEVLKEQRVRASSSPAEGFATWEEAAAWRSVLRATRRRKGRCVDSKLDAFRKLWRQFSPRLDACCVQHGFVVDLTDENRVTPSRTAFYYMSVEFEIRMEMEQAKSIAQHMAVWREKARRRATRSDVVEDVSAAVTGIAGASAALPEATGSTDDDATPAVEEEEKRATHTTVGAGKTEQHVLSVVEDGVGIDNSPGEIGTDSVPLDLGICDGLVLLKEPVNEMCEDSVGKGGNSGSSSSSGGEGGGNGETFVFWEEGQKGPSHGWKRSPRSEGKGGNAVLGVAHPFDRGKKLGDRTVDGARQGFRCWIGDFWTEHRHRQQRHLLGF